MMFLLKKTIPPGKEAPLLALVSTLHLLLLFPIFFPNLSDMNMADEARYINSGRELVEGELPLLARNPLIAVLYGIIYLLVQQSPYWLIHSATIGRFILFGILWTATYLIARRTSEHARLPVMIALVSLYLFIFARLMTNPSDALFTGMSALAFWQLLSYYGERRIKHVWLASLFTGLAALSRSDGLLLFLSLVGASVLLSVQAKRVRECLVACLVPFICIVGGYVLAYILFTGRIELGLEARSYYAFEQGQGIAYSHLYKGKSPWIEGVLESRRLFGTPIENDNSIIKAILSNPDAFIERVVQSAKNLPGQIIIVYGNELAWIVLILFTAGVIVLIKRKKYVILAIFLLWPVHLLIYFVTFYRPNYYLYPFFLVLLMSCIGLTAQSDSTSSPWKSQHILLASIVGVVILLLRERSVFIAYLVSLTLIWIIVRYKSRLGLMKLVVYGGICAGLAIVGGIPTPHFRTLGTNADERAVLYMSEQLPSGFRVASSLPGTVWAAKMTYVPMTRSLRNMSTEHELTTWIIDQSIEAIYVDAQRVRRTAPDGLRLIRSQLGKSLDIGFNEDGVQVLLVKTR